MEREFPVLMAQEIFLFGAGGHAKVVLDIIEKQGLYQVVSIFDDNDSLENQGFCGYRIAGGRSRLLSARDSLEITTGIVAVGDNINRMEVASWMYRSGFDLISAVHPSCQIGHGVHIGSNTVVMAGTVINSDSYIGDSVIVNTAASIDHDCSIGNGVHIGPGCRLCGNVAVGSGALLGVGTVVIPGIRIGERSIIGAGSVVVKDIPNGVVAKGTPCSVEA